jgi:hypothetical protein
LIGADRESTNAAYSAQVPRDSWTRRLDDRLLGPTGLAIVFGLVCLVAGISAISYLLSGSWLALIVNALIALLSGQAMRTQWRRRAQST